MNTRIILLSILIIIASVTKAQVWLFESFNTETFPPAGWEIDNHSENWKYAPSSFAGGYHGEAYFTANPTFNGPTRLISPKMDITDATHLTLYFKHTMRRYSGNFYYGVATRAGNSNWEVAWEVAGSTRIKEEIDLQFTGQESISDFQFCFYMIGSSGLIKSWSIDDIMLYNKQEHDITAKSVITEQYFEPEQEYTPKAMFYNSGLNTDSFNVECKIYDTENNLLFTNLQTITELAANKYKEVTFDSYALPNNADEAYKIVVTPQLLTDVTTANDTVSKYIYTYITHLHEFVLIEGSTATWCSACPKAVKACDSLEELGYNVAIIEYHTNDDYSTPETEQRLADYYSMYAYPTTVFDGGLSVGASTYVFSDFYNRYSIRSIVKTGVSIKISALQSKGTTKNVEVVISKLAPFFFNNTVVQVAIIESHIPEQWQTLYELNHLCRLMLPNAYGTLIDLINQDEVTLNYNFQIDDSWDAANLTVVAFIQDNYTQEVLNATKAKFTDVVSVNEKTTNNNLSLSNYPNPFSASTTINFNIKNSSKVNLSIFDINGKFVTQLINTNINKGNHKVIWTPKTGTVNGVYFIKLIAGNNVKITKVILNKSNT